MIFSQCFEDQYTLMILYFSPSTSWNSSTACPFLFLNSDMYLKLFEDWSSTLMGSDGSIFSTHSHSSLGHSEGYLKHFRWQQTSVPSSPANLPIAVHSVLKINGQYTSQITEYLLEKSTRILTGRYIDLLGNSGDMISNSFDTNRTCQFHSRIALLERRLDT